VDAHLFGLEFLRDPARDLVRQDMGLRERDRRIEGEVEFDVQPVKWLLQRRQLLSIPEGIQHGTAMIPSVAGLSLF